MKTYSKPEILFEDFSLSTNIAANCEAISRLPSEGNCGYLLGADAGDFGGVVIFTQAVVGCYSGDVYETENGDGYIVMDGKDLCYHNPSANYNVFSS